MKALTSIITVLLCSFILNAQVDCKPYVPTNEGSKWELSNYNAKGKFQGKVAYELIKKEASGENVTFTIKATSFDKKGKELFATTYDAVCENGVFKLDMASRMSGDAMKGFQDMDVEVDASEFEIPDLDAAAGTTLEDGSLKVTMSSTGGLGLGMTILITDRKVEEKTSLTTPAGDFDCIVLSQKISTKMMINIKSTSKEWYAEGVGLIRAENYNKKGKMLGYSELTKLEL